MASARNVPEENKNAETSSDAEKRILIGSKDVDEKIVIHADSEDIEENMLSDVEKTSVVEKMQVYDETAPINSTTMEPSVLPSLSPFGRNVSDDGKIPSDDGKVDVS